MKFMFTIYHDEKVLDAMPENEMQALVDAAIEYAEEIRRSGHYLASEPVPDRAAIESALESLEALATELGADPYRRMAELERASLAWRRVGNGS